MATPGNSSDHGHTIAGTSDTGEADDRITAIFSAIIRGTRGVISVLLDIGRLIDRGMALWLALGLPLGRHA